MKKSLVFAIISLVVLCGAVIALVAGCSAKDNTLQLEVDKIVAHGDDQILTLDIENNTGSEVSYGWVRSCKFKVTTTEGRFTCDAGFFKDIPQGDSTQTLKLTNCPGKVKKIVITELCQLNENGLPERELHDATLYNRQKDIDTFEDNFGFFDDPDWLHNILFAVAPIFLVFVLAMRFVVPLFGSGIGAFFHSFGNDQGHFMDMHRQAHEAHMRHAEQQVIHQHMQEAMDFGMRSVTPIEAGGFVPSPPDPPMFF